MTPIAQIKSILVPTFNSKHIEVSLKYYLECIEKYRGNDWEGVALKGGKFVEAVTKALLLYCKTAIPSQRHFKAGLALRSLEQQNSSQFDDVIRIVIPKACIFIYEIVNNRGGRHHADDIDPNGMDSEIILPTMSWILAELVRFTSKGKSPAQAQNIIQSLTKKIYPYFEEIDGRPYINIKNLDAVSTGLAILYYKYPLRVAKKDLSEYIQRHDFKNNAANVAIHRIKGFVDEQDGSYKLRSIGIQKIEEILAKA